MECQKIFENICKKAGVKKEVPIHSPRPSSATHLLESGIDLKYLQERLGYKSSKTTEIHTQVPMKDLRKIKSPFDLMLGNSKKNKQKNSYADQVRNNTKLIYSSNFDQKTYFLYIKLNEIVPSWYC